MKALAFVDVHGNSKAIRKLSLKAKRSNPDICIFAGDISFIGEDIMTILSEINDFGIPTVLVHGNHECEEDTRQACRAFKNLTYIHRDVYDFGSLRFFGYGGGGFALRDQEFEQVANKVFLKRINKRKTNVLLLHGPPYGTKLDRIGKSFVGNQSYRILIENSAFDLVFCGHIHENAGKKDRIQNTVIINPGPSGMILNLHNKL